LPTAPSPKPGIAGKTVVSLASVAKAPPPIPKTTQEVKVVKADNPAVIKQPPKVISARPPGTPVSVVKDEASTPDLVRVRSNAPPRLKSGSKKTTARLLIPSIKLNQPVPEPVVEEEVPGESIILGPGDTVQESPVRPPRIVEKLVAPPLPTPEEKPPVETPVPTPAIEVAKPLVILPPIVPVAEAATTLQPPVLLSKPENKVETSAPVVPPPLLESKSAEAPASTGVHVVPKMSSGEAAAAEKLRPPPQLPHQGGAPASVLPAPVIPQETRAIPRVPSLISEEAKTGGTPPPALPSKSPPPILPEPKLADPIIEPAKPAAPVVTAKVVPPPLEPLLKATKQLLAKPDESKPALKPAVFPNRALANPKVSGPITPLVVVEKEKASVVAPPPITAKTEDGKLHAPVELPHKTPEKPASVLPPKEKAPLPLTRVERAKKRRVWEMVFFYVVMLAVGAGLYFGMIHFTQETRVEGQVIPPAGMSLSDEVWIVNEFRQQTADIAEDALRDRTPKLQEIHERQDHVQRVQADIAMREERIRLLQAQIQSAKDEEGSVVKQARDDAQQLWDGPGAELDDEYNSRQSSLREAISNRAKSLDLKYAPDPAYNAPEVWANAYRLALYEVPKGVDSAKEYTWLNDQMKQWRDFVKAQDDKREQLREQAAQIKMAPAAKLTDLNNKIEELQHRIESTQAEEDPLKPELQQAQTDLTESQTEEANIDPKYYKELSDLPSGSIIKRLPLESNGRFTWGNLENDSPYAEGEIEKHFWIFARATRPDGREYWALGRFSIAKNHIVGLLIEPDSFVSTKAMLRPDLSPDEQAQ
jgi:hypothetical protein